VVEHVRLGVENNFQSFVESLKIGNEHFDAAIRREFANLADGLGKNFGAANVVIVAVYAGHDRVLQS
jgi:hypothetical protein